MSSVTTPNKALRDVLLHTRSTDEEAEAQKDSALGAGPHSQDLGALGFEPEVSATRKDVHTVGQEGADTYHTCPHPRRGH